MDTFGGNSQSVFFQFERQRILALTGDYALVATCSRAKTFRVNNFNVFSKKRDFGQVTPEELEVLKTAAGKHDVDLDAMCHIDNTTCL